MDDQRFNQVRGEKFFFESEGRKTATTDFQNLIFAQPTSLRRMLDELKASRDNSTITSFVVALNAGPVTLSSAELTRRGHARDLAPFVTWLCSQSRSIRQRFWASFQETKKTRRLVLMGMLLEPEARRRFFDLPEETIRVCVLPVFREVLICSGLAIGTGIKRTKKFGFGGIIDAITDAFGTVANVAVTTAGLAASAIDSVLNGIVTVADFVEEMATASVDELCDVLRQIESAGGSITDILLEAARKDITEFHKWVQAACHEFQEITEVMTVLAANIPLVGSTISVILECAFTPMTLLVSAIQYGDSLFSAVTLELLELAGDLNHFLISAAEASIEVLRSISKALIKAGISMEIILLQLSLAPLADVLRGNFLEALMDIGYSVRDIIKTIITLDAEVAAAILTGLLSIAGGRQLNDRELARAKLVYGEWDCLRFVRICRDFSLVRQIQDAAGQLEKDGKGRPYTTYYVIHNTNDQDIPMSILIHELLHVWQYTTQGVTYMIHSIIEQASQGDNAYKVDWTEIKGDGSNWQSFGTEQQAVIIEMYYCKRFENETQPDVAIQLFFGYAKKIWHTPPKFDENPPQPCFVDNSITCEDICATEERLQSLLDSIQCQRPVDIILEQLQIPGAGGGLIDPVPRDVYSTPFSGKPYLHYRD